MVEVSDAVVVSVALLSGAASGLSLDALVEGAAADVVDAGAAGVRLGVEVRWLGLLGALVCTAATDDDS